MMTTGTLCFMWVNDDRPPKLIKHNDICRPDPHPDFIDQVDTSFPGVVIEYPGGYHIEDGVHRIAKLQREGIYESLFYVVTPEELRNGMVVMTYLDLDGRWKSDFVGEWCNGDISIQSHDK
tara:strand:+ start:710 stop:1072 length:363 start_codon:yes stop_codon:yes gene_type:complete